MKNTEIPLGTLTIGEKIGEGGYGEVYKAKQEPFDQEFAIKLFNPHPFHGASGSKLKERFAKEAEHLMHLRHEHIVPIFGFGEFDGRPYILMELFDGWDLYTVRTKLVPPPLAILPFLERVASALGHAHLKGLVHRDVKPPNLLTKTGDARVVDFGIAGIVDETGERFTKQGETPAGDAFSAPELLANPRLLDPRCDIYSLGACWFWLLTGNTPAGLGWESALDGLPDVDRSYAAVLLRALSQPESRYGSMDELIDDLRALRIGESSKASTRDQLDDDTALVLGAIFEEYALDGGLSSPWNLEQSLRYKVSKFGLGICVRKLRQLEYIDSRSAYNSNMHEDVEGFYPTDRGERWVERNHFLVSGLLDDAKKKPARRPEPVSDEDFDDDIPF